MKSYIIGEIEFIGIQEAKYANYKAPIFEQFWLKDYLCLSIYVCGDTHLLRDKHFIETRIRPIAESKLRSCHSTITVF